MKLNNHIKSIAIGSFDGIHIAHQKLISQAQAVVIIEKHQATITPGFKRVEYINKPSFFYLFDKIKSLSAKEFIDRLHMDFPMLQKIVVGYDFVFGHNKEGNTQLLKELFNGEVQVIDEVIFGNISVHSCIIKDYIATGDIELANALLNHPYKISGNIIKGQGIGKKELVPTINIEVKNSYILPKHGVYATKTLIDNQWLPSVSFLGHRAISDNSFAIETHILDREIEVTKGDIELKFIAFIRPNREFDDFESLREQIQRDIRIAKRRNKQSQED